MCKKKIKTIVITSSTDYLFLYISEITDEKASMPSRKLQKENNNK